MQGIVVDVRPLVRNDRLRVEAMVRTEENQEIDAYLPDRELAAILPRSVMLGEARSAPLALLESIAPIVERMAGKRRVRVWEYKGTHYFGFLSWKSVSFAGHETPGS